MNTDEGRGLSRTEQRRAIGIEAPGIELRVEVPGGYHARYEAEGSSGALRVVEVVYPAERLPGDLCSVTDSLVAGNASLGAILLGNVSLPAGCLVWARPLALLEIRTEDTIAHEILAVGADDPHFAEVVAFGGLSGERRAALESFLQENGQGKGGQLRWLGKEDALSAVLAARQRFRIAQNSQREGLQLEPAWKPVDGRLWAAWARDEAERHTAAEYSFHLLPNRFQRYVEEYLAMDERILCAVHRPSMRSARRRKLLKRSRLEEGVLIVSDQQVTQVVELFPLDRAGIRYGFIARAGVPERMESVRVVPLGHGVIGLEVAWRAARGSEKLIWEFPDSQRADLEQAAGVLMGWLPRDKDHRLRRASPPAPPEVLPELRDPAANDPEAVKPLAERLISDLCASLSGDEAVLARCLLPAWVEGRKAASLVAVTSKRLVVVPDPEDPKGDSLRIDVPLAAISSLEFCSTLVQAYLRLSVPLPLSGTPRHVTIEFGKTLAAMNTCYLMLRRAMATTAVSELIAHDQEAP